MPSLNVQADVRRRLADALFPTEVRITVPAEHINKKLVVVTREGGSRKNALLDGPGLGIYCWAETENEASLLADQVADAIVALPFEAGYASVIQESMRSDPDPDSRLPRWYLSYTLTTFIPKGE